jgi:hypothetical protein
LSGINPSRTSLPEALYGRFDPDQASRFLGSIEDELFRALVVGPVEVKMGCGQEKQTHGPRLFRSHPSAVQIFGGVFSESYAESFASPMSERQRSVGETTRTSISSFLGDSTSPAWPHARAFTRTPHTLCDASILAPSSIAILPFVALRRCRPHRDTTKFYRLRATGDQDGKMAPKNTSESYFQRRGFSRQWPQVKGSRSKGVLASNCLITLSNRL